MKEAISTPYFFRFFSCNSNQAFVENVNKSDDSRSGGEWRFMAAHLKSQHLLRMRPPRPSRTFSAHLIVHSVSFRGKLSGQVKLWLPQRRVLLQATNLSHPPPSPRLEGL